MIEFRVRKGEDEDNAINICNLLLQRDRTVLGQDRTGQEGMQITQ